MICYRKTIFLKTIFILCFSVLIQLIESYELLCVCSSDFIVCFFLIVVMMIFQCEREHSVCSKAYNLVTET